MTHQIRSTDDVRGRWSQAVVKVGTGRGFVAETTQGDTRLIVTAGDCLPRLPRPTASPRVQSRIFPRLLAGLGKRRAVWAECLFIDPIANIAVLGCPDLSIFGSIAERYTAFVNARTTIPVGNIAATDPPTTSGAGNTSASDAAQPQTSPVWLLVGDSWVRRDLVSLDGALQLTGATGEALEAASGSPIVNHQGAAVGIFVSAATAGHRPRKIARQTHPALAHHLPVWLASKLGVSGAA